MNEEAKEKHMDEFIFIFLLWVLLYAIGATDYLKEATKEKHLSIRLLEKQLEEK